MSTIPKLSEIQQLAYDKLSVDTRLVAAQVPVVLHDGLKDAAIEELLDTIGIVAVVCPVTMWKLRDQSGPEWILDCELMVQVRCNPGVNQNTNEGSVQGVEADLLQTCIDVMRCMTHIARHGGGEFFRLAQDSGTLADFDTGLWSYTLLFTKEVTL